MNTKDKKLSVSVGRLIAELSSFEKEYWTFSGVDLGIAKCHFEIAAGTDIFEWA